MLNYQRVNPWFPVTFPFPPGWAQPSSQVWSLCRLQHRSFGAGFLEALFWMVLPPGQRRAGDILAVIFGNLWKLTHLPNLVMSKVCYWSHGPVIRNSGFTHENSMVIFQFVFCMFTRGYSCCIFFEGGIHGESIGLFLDIRDGYPL